MKTSLSNLKTFSQCPALYKFSSNKELVTTVSSRQAVFTKVAKLVYLQVTRLGYPPEWRSIVGWIDKEVFTDIDVSNEEQFEAARMLCESILIPLRTWYYKYFIPVEGYLDLELSGEIDGHILTSSVSLIKLHNDPEFTIFSLENPSKVNLYNDIEIRGISWLIAKELHSDNVNLEYITIGPKRSLEVAKIKFNRSSTKRTEVILGQILSAMNKRFYYPSRTIACETCPFRKECII